MPTVGEKPMLLVVDPSGAAGGRAARKSLARLQYPTTQVKDARGAWGTPGNLQPAVVLLVADPALPDPSSLCASVLEALPASPTPLLVLLSGRAPSKPVAMAAQFLAPFDWDAVVDRLEQLLALATLQAEQAALGTLLQLSRVEIISIDTDSQSCRVTETLAALLGLPGVDTTAGRRERSQPIHWQKLFASCDEPERARVLDIVSGALESGLGFEAEYDIPIERHHKRRVRLTGHPIAGAPASPPRRVDLVIQDVTPVVARSTNDAANRLLDTTLGLRSGDRVLQSMIRIVEESKKGTILLLRLQGLADFYRQYGYETGGALLRTYAESIEAGLRTVPGVVRVVPNKEQVLARLAGGEFLVLIPEMTDDQSMVGPLSRLLEATRRAIASDARLTVINTRIGMASWPRDGTSPDVLLRAGGLACDYFSMGESDGLDTLMAAVVRSREQARLEYDLHLAIERRQLQLHYQPKLSIPDGRIVGFEALLRWQHQKNLFIPPTIFIPIAERTGLIAQLGAWVIDRAVEQIGMWRSDGTGLVPLAVNVSAQQIASGDVVVANITSACKAHLVEPLFLQVEVTESCLIQDAESASKLLGEVRRLGCHIALDDFGTGYSSLSYLRRLPLDILKIDRSFTSAISAEQGDRSLAYNIIGIGRSLGLKVIAEGVTTALQWDALGRWGCAEAQGYLISQAIPAATASALWKHGRWNPSAHKLVAPSPASQSPASQSAA
jgi:EAL domain-containing protein (putative c-di-GMP-specific phosphodiesterase class I)/GGDEF domain-containing protein/PAS domain-containing protein